MYQYGSLGLNGEALPLARSMVDSPDHSDIKGQLPSWEFGECGLSLAPEKSGSVFYFWNTLQLVLTLLIPPNRELLVVSSNIFFGPRESRKP